MFTACMIKVKESDKTEKYSSEQIMTQFDRHKSFIIWSFSNDEDGC